MLDTSMINEGDTATIFYGSEPSMKGTVKVIRKNATGRVYRVGIVPETVDHVAWFHPVNDFYGEVVMFNATSTAIAYV